MQENEILDELIEYLLSENPEFQNIIIPENHQEKFQLYRSLVNIRPVKKAAPEFLGKEDEYLSYLLKKKGIIKIENMESFGDDLYLWQGDITRIQCGAIVNAANSGMTGCWQPCHSCIDNCIHTFAGVRLRYKCGEIMQRQGYEEPTGQAKITPAYNLPCEYVIHTVGPIVQGRLTQEHCRLLKSSYQSCLKLAVQTQISSIAFCCISTGVFGFPQQEAAEIAVDTIQNFQKNHDIKIIFNVFKEEDYEIYRKILSATKKSRHE